MAGLVCFNDKLMLATYFLKRQQSRVASAIQQRASLAGRCAPIQHLSAAMNSQGTFFGFQKQSFASRNFLKQLNLDKAATLKQRHEEPVSVAVHATLVDDSKSTTTQAE